MITSLIEMLELPKFGEVISFICHIIYSLKYVVFFILKRPGVANFVDIIKIAINLIKTTL